MPWHRMLHRLIIPLSGKCAYMYFVQSCVSMHAQQQNQHHTRQQVHSETHLEEERHLGRRLHLIQLDCWNLCTKLNNFRVSTCTCTHVRMYMHVHLSALATAFENCPDILKVDWEMYYNLNRIRCT